MRSRSGSRVEAQRAGVVLALIARRRHEPAARGAARRLRRADLEPRGRPGRTEAIAREVEHARLDARRRASSPRRSSGPGRSPSSPIAAGARASRRGRTRRIGGRGAAARQAFHQRERVLEEADRGTGHALVRVGVTPGPDEAAARRAESREQARDRVRVGVGPAAHRVHGARDRGVVLADRALAPVVVAQRVAQPAHGVGLGRREPLLPERAPRRAPTSSGSGGCAHELEEDAAPPEVVVQQTPAHVVDVVRIAVVGRAHGDDSAQRAAAGARRSAAH